MNVDPGLDHGKEQLAPTRAAVNGRKPRKTASAGGRRARQQAQPADGIPCPVWTQESWERALSPRASTQAQGGPALEWREPHRPHRQLVSGRTEARSVHTGDGKEGRAGATTQMSPEDRMPGEAPDAGQALRGSTCTRPRGRQSHRQEVDGGDWGGGRGRGRASVWEDGKLWRCVC